MLVWHRKRLLYKPGGNHDWSQEYAQVPRGYIDNGVLRIFYATRGLADSDANYVSNIGCVSVKDESDLSVIKCDEQQVLAPGKVGRFDHYGVMPGSVNVVDGKIYLYYTGWSRKTDVPYSTAIGLAISDDGKSFYHRTEGPILGLDDVDPYLVNGPFVYRHDNHFHMWYASATKWFQSNKRWECHYDIRHAVSNDGLTWHKSGKPCIQPVLEDECQNAPCVFRHNKRFHMIFCYRYATDFRNSERGYRIGYAYSEDLEHWVRDDSLLEFSGAQSDWDNEMMCYPWVTQFNDKMYLFYCGNYFGRAGFGFAELLGG
ncbi:MAG: hypothetical protein V2I33_04665 [Kangiellaceae bacterium]|jgi:predicted GH43/DUF377 family glycosyl hydrolase|nr:hypothetical protein [Kangiellaceae bacterium]